VDLSEFRAEISFRSGAGHRAALALKGVDLSEMVSTNDPKKENSPSPPVKPLDSSDAARRTAEICNSFIRQADDILASHPLNIERIRKGLPPANTILIRGAGMMGHFEPFEQKYGISGSVISAASLITGIGTAVGLEAVHVDGITGSADSDLDAKLKAAIAEFGRKDFVLVNIKGADESGHDGNAVKKRDFVEKIDESLGRITVPEECLLLICADHSTPCSIKDHSADPVPVIIHGDGVRVDCVSRYDEISCASGGMCRITGDVLMPTLLDLINKAHKYGA
jgi:2,3-bisphosphoglycerate-independent phosphoglycerate mutase